MSVAEVLGTVRTRWKAAAAAVLLSSLVAVLLGSLVPAGYTSRVVVAVTSRNVDLDLRLAYYGGRLFEDDGNPYVGYFDALAQRRFEGGREIVPRDAELLATAVIGQRSITMDVVGRSARPGAAAAAAARSAQAFVAVVPQRSPRTRNGAPIVTARVIEAARRPTETSGPGPVSMGMVAGVWVLTAGVAVPLIAERFARRRKDATASTERGST